MKGVIEWEGRVMQFLSPAKSLMYPFLKLMFCSFIYLFFSFVSQVVHIELRKSEAGAETQQILCGE